MSIVRFIGCLHLGHESIAKHRGFPDSYHHDENLIFQWNNIVGKKDVVYILGDITMETKKHYDLLDRLKGIKYAVLGNHDRRQDVRELLNYVDSVAGMVDYKGFVLTHCPIHPMEIGSCRGNIHAHIHHENKLMEYEANKLYHDDTTQIKTLDKYYCVDAHLINYQPKTLEELINKI
jgi:calcineurin-like phosphoesterase family protein